MSNQAIINRLLTIEAQADQLREDCRKARRLFEGGVSTSPKKVKGLTDAQIAKVIANRKKSLIKNS
ncbi:hypothetical protein [Flavitalea sp.]|nr:hypothetical protein [Flavitalea sp.]